MLWQEPEPEIVDSEEAPEEDSKEQALDEENSSVKVEEVILEEKDYKTYDEIPEGKRKDYGI